MSVVEQLAVMLHYRMEFVCLPLLAGGNCKTAKSTRCEANCSCTLVPSRTQETKVRSEWLEIKMSPDLSLWLPAEQRLEQADRDLASFRPSPQNFKTFSETTLDPAPFPSPLSRTPPARPRQSPPQSPPPPPAQTLILNTPYITW